MAGFGGDFADGGGEGARRSPAVVEGSGAMERGRGSRLFDVADLDEVFRYLYGVEGSALADLVAGEPEGDAVIVGEVFADAADVDIVFASGLEGHGVDVVLRVVDESDARGVG